MKRAQVESRRRHQRSCGTAGGKKTPQVESQRDKRAQFEWWQGAPALVRHGVAARDGHRVVGGGKLDGALLGVGEEEGGLKAGRLVVHLGLTLERLATMARG
eukprot:509539-Prymnesium_polylepis.1